MVEQAKQLIGVLCLVAKVGQTSGAAVAALKVPPGRWREDREALGVQADVQLGVRQVHHEASARAE